MCVCVCVCAYVECVYVVCECSGCEYGGWGGGYLLRKRGRLVLTLWFYVKGWSEGMEQLSGNLKDFTKCTAGINNLDYEQK